MKSKIISIVLILIIVGGIIFFVSKKSNKENILEPVSQSKTEVNEESEYQVKDTASTEVKKTEVKTTNKAGEYLLTDVAKHKTASDCWTTINGNVYNVTSWIGEHPGGSQAIISLCGIDGSDAFNGKHGGQSRPENELASFKIGILK